VIGALIALCEYKVFVKVQVWGVNSCDQWGEELGKILGEKVHAALSEDTAPDATADFDASTTGLIKAFRSMKKTIDQPF
jgi:glucose-6-phosphate isomerase